MVVIAGPRPRSGILNVRDNVKNRELRVQGIVGTDDVAFFERATVEEAFGRAQIKEADMWKYKAADEFMTWLEST